MVPYLGDFSEDATVRIGFNTFDSNDPSASVTITNLADADIKVHKNGSTTEIVTDGATVAIDFDGITGNHLVTIDTSVHADYSTGSDYHVRMEGTTVDGATINAWIGHFSIENRHPGTTANTILTDTEAILTDSEAILTDSEAILSDSEATLADTNELQGDWTNGGRLDLIIDAVLVDTEAIITDTETGITERATLLTDTEAILTDTEGLDTATLLTDTEAILADTEARGLTPLATGTAQSGTASTIVLAAASSFADNVLNGNGIKITGGTGAGQHRIITSNTLADDTCNVTPNWTTNPSSDSTYEIIEGSVNLAAVRETAQTAGDIIADTEALLVDTEAILVDSEAILTDSEAILTDTEGLDTATILTDTEAILGDTNELQTDWVNGGRLDLILDAILVDTEGLDTATILTDTEAILADTEAATAVLTDTEAILTDTEAVLADTEARGLTALATGTAQSGTASTIVLAAASAFADNELNGNIVKVTGGTGAGQSRVITSNTNADDTCNITPNWATNPSSDSTYEIVEGAANLTAVALTAQTAGDIIADTEAVLVDSEAIITDTEAILADTNELQGDWANGGRLDLIIDSILVDTEATITDTEAVLADTEAATAVLTDTEAILADTNELQGDWVNGGRLDLIIDAILVDTEAVILDTEAVLTDSEAILTDTESINTAAILTDTEAILADTEGTLSANVTQVNSVTVGGAGTEADPWGPA